jgi:hypothetical protein
VTDRIVVDADKMQQISGRLNSSVQTAQGIGPGQQPSGPLGNTGAIENQMSTLNECIVEGKQGVTRDMGKMVSALSQVVSHYNQSDQQQAQEAQKLRET